MKKCQLNISILSCLLPIAISTLSSCTLLGHHDFECAPGKGVGCKPIDYVNRTLKSNRDDRPINNEPVLPPLPPLAKGQRLPTHSPARVKLADGRMAHWVPESIQRIWVAAYQDTKGFFHDAKQVYVVVHPGFWRVA